MANLSFFLRDIYFYAEIEFPESPGSSPVTDQVVKGREQRGTGRPDLVIFQTVDERIFFLMNIPGPR